MNRSPWHSHRVPRGSIGHGLFSIHGRELCRAQGSRIQTLPPLLQHPLWSLPHRREVCTPGHGIRPSGQPPRLPAKAQRRAGPAPAVCPADLRGGTAAPLLLEQNTSASVDLLGLMGSIQVHVLVLRLDSFPSLLCPGHLDTAP